MEAYSPHPRFVFHCNPGCSNAARQVAVNITTTIHRYKLKLGRSIFQLSDGIFRFSKNPPYSLTYCLYFCPVTNN